MVETDWREILSFSQRELGQADKEKLCESLSWMEADDIELNFSDLKTLFRLAQDILKYKNEQVNNLMGKLESSNRKSKKGKDKAVHADSPASTDSVLETIANQEAEIKANKEILEQLYRDITELEGKKNELEKGKNNSEKDSNSSKDALSEMDTVVQLENEVAMKNRHIRKLLVDVKSLEDENLKLKEKVSVLKDKLLEATQLIDNLTEQLISINNDCSQLKEMLGASEKAKVELSCQIESLRKEIFEKKYNKENIYEEIKSKVQHWKNIARTKKAELETLSFENERLKESLNQFAKQVSSPKSSVRKDKSHKEEQKIKELQEKLIEAANEMELSANLINVLKAENKQLKGVIEETPDSTVTDIRNESDDNKQRILINKLKRKIKNLSVSLQGAEEMIAVREKELAEIASELQLLQSDEGIDTLLQGLKHKKRELKVKDEGIKSLVQDVNDLNQQVNDLQLENETLRQKCGVPMNAQVSTVSIVQKYQNLEQNNTDMCKEIRRLENKLVGVELQHRNLIRKFTKATKLLSSSGYEEAKLEELLADSDSDIEMLKTKDESSKKTKYISETINEIPQDSVNEAEMKKIAEENEGLRKGLQEILDFLKDNSTTSSGILALQCPSLEALLRSMEARHAAGWFAPHMATIMELRSAIGGKDALLTALHEARKETYDVMTQLSKETEKTAELERELEKILTAEKQTEIKGSVPPQNTLEFGSWMSEKDYYNVNINNKIELESIIDKGNMIYESHLKNGLEYFHNKFRTLYDKITTMSIQAADDNNKWSILEEQYKAQIESLKSQVDNQDDDDVSDNSPGLISIPDITQLQRKCSYLEDSYKYIRTLNENIKNENMDAKRQMMTISSEYETEIQRLILAITNLTDKLRNSVPLEIFWKQNTALNKINIKYRKVIDKHINENNYLADLLKRLESDKLDIINNIQKQFGHIDAKRSTQQILSSIEESVLKKQLERLCKELDDNNKKVKDLENINGNTQEALSKLIDNSIAAITKDDIDLMKSQLQNVTQENKLIKEQCKHVTNQLHIALLQLQEHQQRQMSNDMEVNLLRHQILDLQSNSDSKAIVARLSGEVLVAHLQASENNKKMERLNFDLNKEKELRIESEEMFKARQKVFDVYSCRYDLKFKYMFEVLQVLRQQYQGSVPLISIENYLNNIEDLSRTNHAIHEKLVGIEDLRSNLMAKHSVFDQILDVSKNKCFMDNNSCSHKLKAIMKESIHSREIDHLTKKFSSLEQSREDLLKHCNNLEKTLVLVNQGFGNSMNKFVERKHSQGEINISLELEDIQSDDDSSTHKSQTVTLPKPQILKPIKAKMENKRNENNDQPKQNPETIDSQSKTLTTEECPKVQAVHTQTSYFEKQSNSTATQTIAVNDGEINRLKQNLALLDKDIDKKRKELSEALHLMQQRNQENFNLSCEKNNLEASVRRLNASCNQKDKSIEKLRMDYDELKNELDNLRSLQLADINKKQDTTISENKSLILALKQLESDKNAIATEYKELLRNEREEYSNTIQSLNVKLIEMQSKLDRKGSDSNSTNGEALKDVINKYTVKIVELEDQAFKLQSELDECRVQLTTYKSEMDRWKDLATERLLKMEQLNSQLEERHCNEVESYKQENQHWLTQLNDTQKEHLELRSKLTEQKALHVKQLAEKDGQIEHMRSVISNLKTQVMNMQTMISVHDPSFDLSAIVEVDEASDAMSHGSDRLEIKFDSSGELNEDEFGRIGTSSTTIWQEPVIERLRRDKQLAGKQNAILRRQIKALAARERRSRLDAQNLKNQVFRISSSGSRVATAESAALQNKIAMLQAQLTSARRETHSSIALWDKWKRAQQAADRWQSRYEEKCQELKKMDANLHMAKSAVSRLEREKRSLMHRIAELRGESQISIEKQDTECAEKSQRSIECPNYSDAPPLSNSTLLERIEAQQRRIVALTLAEKGNEHLVSEYEKALAEITSLKGQVLKLESTLLESQIRLPLKSATDPQPELEYWKNYCEMLKEENVQLNLRVNSMGAVPITAHQHKINDLEQTVLTLRGLVSKLQAEQKSSTTVYKRIDSRPSSERSGSEKGPTRLESHRIEIVNLKRSIHDKDLLLERSKEMLKIAAEREDELLRENAFLRRQLNDHTISKQGFLSA